MSQDDMMTMAEAIDGLDPADDDDWTEGGKPALAALATTLGRKVLRAEVNERCPDAVRSVDNDPEPGEPAPEPVLTDSVKGGNVEVSCLEACIRAMDEACNAFGAIPPQRQDSELRGIIQEYTDQRAGVIKRLARVEQRASQEE